MSMIGYFKAISPSRLKSIKKDKAAQKKFCSTDGAINVDKTWEIIHFTLTGNKQVDGAGSLSVDPFGIHHFEVDLGYGPASYLDPEEVGEVAEHLNRINPDSFSNFINAEELASANVYGSNEESDEEIIEYVLPYYKEVRDLYLKTVKGKKGIVFWVM